MRNSSLHLCASALGSGVGWADPDPNWSRNAVRPMGAPLWSAFSTGERPPTGSKMDRYSRGRGAPRRRGGRSRSIREREGREYDVQMVWGLTQSLHFTQKSSFDFEFPNPIPISIVFFREQLDWRVESTSAGPCNMSSGSSYVTSGALSLNLSAVISKLQG